MDAPNDYDALGWPTLLRCDMTSLRSWVMPVTPGSVTVFGAVNGVWVDARRAGSVLPPEPLELPSYMPMMVSQVESAVWRTTARATGGSPRVCLRMRDRGSRASARSRSVLRLAGRESSNIGRARWMK